MGRRVFATVLLAASAAAFSWACAPSAVETADPVVVYLVRHAERAEDGTNDPPISEEGEARARELAELLADAGVDHVHSTDLRRTRQTGGPFVEAAGLPIEVYDPRDLTGFAASLRATPGRHLVLGHSNTTPDLVAALGGAPGGPIDEMEYDRLYIVTIPAVGPTSTVLLRYGSRYAAGVAAEG